MPLLVSVIIPVRNEAERLGALVESLGRLDPKPEIVVSESGSTDGSADIARAHGAIVVQGPRGRGNQLNTGAAAASGDVLLFLHADSILPASSWSRLHEDLADRSLEAGAFCFSLAGTAGFWPRVYEFFVWRRSRWLGLPYGDQGYFVRKETWRRVGPFAALPLMEDVQWWKRLRRHTKPRLVDSPLITSPRRFQKRGWLASAVRNLSLLTAWKLGVDAGRIAKWYR